MKAIKSRSVQSSSLVLLRDHFRTYDPVQFLVDGEALGLHEVTNPFTTLVKALVHVGLPQSSPLAPRRLVSDGASIPQAIFAAGLMMHL